MFQFFPSRIVALSVYGFDIHWYGLMYFFSFLIAWHLVPRLQNKRNLKLTNDDWASLLSAAVIGVIVGGRLGFVFFYQPFYFFHHPDQIFAVWNGGMASHGGFIGVTLALLYATRWRTTTAKLCIGDIAVIPVAIGLSLGRIGNFINQELYGTLTTLPWGMEFPGVVGLRHPIQIYDFLIELCIAFICYKSLSSTPIRPGRTIAIFLVLYSFARFFLEYIREQNGVYFVMGSVVLSQGQMLTIPLLIAGIWLFSWTGKRQSLEKEWA